MARDGDAPEPFAHAAELSVQRAEARAQTALAAAFARASASIEQANVRAEALVSERRRRAQERCRQAGPAFHQAPPDHESVALRAYFKAEHRGFEPGKETEDWLQAERELLVTRRHPIARETI